MLTDEEFRTLAIKLLTTKTDRDKQTRIGASTLSGGCDKCLAEAFLGNNTSSPLAERAWMGRTWGTAQHSILEQRLNEALDFDGLTGSALEQAREQVQTLLGLNPDAKAERHVMIADIPGYGWFGGTIDIDLGDQIGDWKSTTRKKLCVLIDFINITRGLDAPYGRTHTWVKMSEKVYAEEMLMMRYKVDGYFGQAMLYLLGSGAKRASLIMLARDGTGVNDNPAANRYEDPKAVHDVYVLSFDFDPAHAQWLIDRGATIWAHLEAGGKPADMASHPQCFSCKTAHEDAAKVIPNIDIEASFPTAA